MAMFHVIFHIAKSIWYANKFSQHYKNQCTSIENDGRMTVMTYYRATYVCCALDENARCIIKLMTDVDMKATVCTVNRDM